MFADVIVNISHESVDRAFEYKIPDGLAAQVRVGSKVSIPFGRSDKAREGYVIAVRESPSYDPEKIKSISSVVEKSVSIEDELIGLAEYIHTTYGGTMNQALKTVLPVKVSARPVTEKYICLEADEVMAQALSEKYSRSKASTAKARLAKELITEKIILYSIVRNKLNISPPTIKALEKDGFARMYVRENLRDVLKVRGRAEYDIVLNDEQRAISDDIFSRYSGGDKRPSLIRGITGSGKTEIYIDLIDRMLKKGRQAIVLIPEIALTYQTVMRFYRKFGDRVSMINSRMTPAERYDQIEKARSGRIDIIVGPRSALFTPFNDLGIVIIDEEHEGTYRNENVPRYHAADVAIKRCEMSGGIVVMGSATPSIESSFKAQNGAYKLYTLKRRAKGASLPEVDIVDLREELAAGNRSMISARLNELILEKLDRREQIMLFINKRGYSSFVSCRSCGKAVMCPHCDVSLKYHNNGRLICHYCGYETPMMKRCPECGSQYIGKFGTGTQKLEEEINRLYPQARTLRMDFDTTREKDGHEKILSAFSDHEADILIGTQMIVKGHDFPAVTLVGIVAADMSLYNGDFSAPERTFQLLTQAAGRAGRGEAKGNVVIQTYSPDNYAIELGAAQDYEQFYEFEMQYRKLLSYPPLVNMLSVLVTGINSRALEERCDEIGSLMDEAIRKDGRNITKLGPVKAGISRINDRYRMVIYLKSADFGDLTYMKDLVENYINTAGKDVLASFDFA